MPQKLSDDVISAAIEGFQAQKRRLDEQIQELRSLLPGSAPSRNGSTSSATGPRRKMSAAARKRIAAAQKKRWAAIREKSGSSKLTTRSSSSERKLSAAGRKRIIEANKKRWAAVRAAKAKTAGA
jgi:cell division septum initiation protein DivIVA